MFIVSKRNYMVRRADDSAYLIPKDFIGEIPQDVAESDLVQRAIKGGTIAVPEGKDILVPALKKHVKEINITDRKIVVELPEWTDAP